MVKIGIYTINWGGAIITYGRVYIFYNSREFHESAVFEG